MQTFTRMSIRALDASAVFLRRPNRELHLHIGQATVICDSPEPWERDAEGLLSEARALRRLADLAGKAADELEERADERRAAS